MIFFCGCLSVKHSDGADWAWLLLGGMAVAVLAGRIVAVQGLLALAALLP